MAHAPTPSDSEFLRARAQVARTLVREGVLGAEDALAYTVWPTPKVRSSESLVKRNTIAARAYSSKLNT